MKSKVKAMGNCRPLGMEGRKGWLLDASQMSWIGVADMEVSRRWIGVRSGVRLRVMSRLRCGRGEGVWKT